MEIEMLTYGFSPKQKEEIKSICDKYGKTFVDLQERRFKIIGDDLEAVIEIITTKKLANTEEFFKEYAHQLATSGKKKSNVKTIIGIIVIVAVCILIYKMCSGPTTPQVELNGKITKTATQLIVSNNDTSDWTDIEVTINDDWSCKVPIIRHGEVFQIGFLNFTKSDGQKFNPFEYSVKNVTLSGHKNGEIAVIVGTFN